MKDEATPCTNFEQKLRAALKATVPPEQQEEIYIINPANLVEGEYIGTLPTVAKHVYNLLAEIAGIHLAAIRVLNAEEEDTDDFDVAQAQVVMLSEQEEILEDKLLELMSDIFGRKPEQTIFEIRQGWQVFTVNEASIPENLDGRLTVLSPIESLMQGNWNNNPALEPVFTISNLNDDIDDVGEILNSSTIGAGPGPGPSGFINAFHQSHEPIGIKAFDENMPRSTATRLPHRKHR